uniref:Putative cytochrome P450 n=1 Tax=Moniliophthora roreri TaxID=221103 RepID=A0A0W0EY02_MONRR
MATLTSSQSLHFATFIGGATLVYLLLQIIFYKRRNASYPGPPGLPLIGNLLDLRSTQPLLKHPGKAFHDWGRYYGSPAVSLRIPGASLLVFNQNKDVQELLVKRSNIYTDRPRAVMLNEMMGGEYLLPFMKYDERFRITRKTFHQLTNTKDIVRPNQVQAVRRMLRRLLNCTDRYDNHVRLMTGDFILSSSYGITPMSAEEPYIKRSNKLVILVSESNQRDAYIVDVFPWLKYIPAWFPGASFKRLANTARQDFQDARELPFQYVKEQLAQGTAKPSLASHFLEAIHSGPDTPEVKNRKEQELAATLGNVYLGAADTTNAAIWSYVLIIALHPEVQKKGQAAVDAVLNGRLPTFEDFREIPYVDAIIGEVFRFSPITPLGVPHVTRTADVYDGHLIPKGTMVFGNLWALLREECIYGKDVDKFVPERFLTNEGEIDPVREHHLYDTAFGWGRRICPGKDLAREMLWLTAASLLATFDILDPVDADGKPIDPVNIDEKYTQRPVSMPPYFTVTMKARSPLAESLIQGDIEEEMI